MRLEQKNEINLSYLVFDLKFLFFDVFEEKGEHGEDHEAKYPSQHDIAFLSGSNRVERRCRFFNELGLIDSCFSFIQIANF